MPRLSAKRIRDYFQQGDNSITTAEKGKALEDLICYLVEKVPGIEVVKRNQLNAFDTEEIDVAFWNNQAPNGFYFLPHIILVECKNWSKAVGSQEVSYFANRLRNRGCDYGILVATNGITGVAEELTRANYELAMALAQGLRILVITRVEIEALTSTEQLVLLFKEKLCELTVSGTLFL